MDCLLKAILLAGNHTGPPLLLVTLYGERRGRVVGVAIVCIWLEDERSMALGAQLILC